MLAATGAPVLLLSELDQGMARSGQRHATRELASRLGCGYAFGVEFLELGLGDVREREAHAGVENAVGYHGGAILSSSAFVETALVRVERSGRWFDGVLGERRVGGRIAVLCRLSLGGRELAVASVTWRATPIPTSARHSSARSSARSMRSPRARPRSSAAT
jgi:hypothetical protein